MLRQLAPWKAQFTLTPQSTGPIYLATAQEKLGNWRSALDTYRGTVQIGAATDQISLVFGKAYLVSATSIMPCPQWKGASS